MLIFKIRWPAGGVCTRQCVCSRTQQNKWPGAVALRPPPHFFTSRMVSAVAHSRPSQWILAWFAISSFVVFWVMLAAQCNE